MRARVSHIRRLQFFNSKSKGYMYKSKKKCKLKLYHGTELYPVNNVPCYTIGRLQLRA